MCKDCEWEDFISEIDDILASGECDWAEDTLTGIRGTVEEMEHCTDRQKEAVSNIENSGGR